MFLTLPNTSVQAELIIGRINQRGGYWLDIPVLDHFYGYRKDVNRLKNRLETIGKNLEKYIRHCLKQFNEINRNIFRSSSILFHLPLLRGSLQVKCPLGVQKKVSPITRCSLSQISYVKVRGRGGERSNCYRPSQKGTGECKNRQIQRYVMVKCSIKSFLISSIDKISEGVLMVFQLKLYSITLSL